MDRVKTFFIYLFLVFFFMPSIFAFAYGSYSATSYDQAGSIMASESLSCSYEGEAICSGSGCSYFACPASNANLVCVECASILSPEALSQLSALVGTGTLIVPSSGGISFPAGSIDATGNFIVAPPQSLETVMTGIVEGNLYNENGVLYAQIPPVDRSGVVDANVSCASANSNVTACTYVAPSGASYVTYLPTGSATGSTQLETSLTEMYQMARSMPGSMNPWDSRDIDLENAVLGFGSEEGHNFAISQSGGYVLGVAETVDGSSEVVIDLYSTPSQINSYGQYHPSVDMEEKLVTLSFGRGSMTENYTVNNVNTGQVQTVDNTVGAVQVLSGLPSVSALSNAVQYYVGSSTVTAVNPVTGQTVGTVNLSGQTLTPYRVERVVEAINNNPSAVHGGSAVIGSPPGSNSGNTGSNTSSTAGSLPTGVASKAGTGSGTNQIGSGGFYESAYPAGTTLQSLYASHLASIQALPFVATLNSLKPTFGAGGLPQMCFTLIMFPGNYCVDFSHYAFVFDTFKALVLLGAVFSAYSIIIIKKA